MSPKQFQLSVKLMADNGRGQYLFLRRSQSSKHFKGLWEMPGGKVDPGEPFDAALLREVKEETGLTAVLERVAGSDSCQAAGKELAYVFMEGRYEPGELCLSPEHDKASWWRLDEVLEQRDVLCSQFKDFVTSFCRARGFGPNPKKENQPSVDEMLEKLDEHVMGYCEVRPSYEALAQELTKILEKETARICPLALVEARPKGVTSFAEKILRKNKYKDPLKEITDLCGVRIVTHLKSEVDAMCAFIRENFRIDERNSLDTLSRLQPSEFGYRSVHYVAQIRRDLFPGLSADLYELKAEIQVRTMLQHAWSDIGHDRLYKGGFKVPAVWAREAARIAAVLESVDDSFGRMVEGLEGYRSDYGAYLTPEEIERESKTTEALRQRDLANASLVERGVRLAMAAGEWEKVRKAVEAFKGPRTPALEYCLGTALCNLHRKDPKSAKFEEGRDYLRAVAAKNPSDTESRLRLAEFETHPEQRLQLFEAAFTADPSDPEALGSYVREKILVERDASFAPLLRPSLESAIEKCRLQIAAGLDVPGAFLRIARFSLLLGLEWEAIDALAHATRWEGNKTAVAGRIDAALEEAETLGKLDPARSDVACLTRFLSLARHFLAPTEKSLARLKALATPGAKPIPGPVTIVAGGCDPSLQSEMEGYRDLLEQGFARYQGTVLSGGTKEGVSGLVGGLGKASQGRIHTIGYLPILPPSDKTAHEDERFSDLRLTAGQSGFSALEPLQNWIDLLAGGIDPSSVRLLGINGGRIASLEYRIAWALGARVAIVRKSGREADKLEREIEAQTFSGVLVLPHDPMTVRAFLHGGQAGSSVMDDEQQERLARWVHAKFLEENRHKNPDHAMRPWEHLDPGLQHSNLDQVAYMTEILGSAGFEVVPEVDPRPSADIKPQIENMAEREHGRWNVERLAKGWRLGPRDPEKKTSPYLVGWGELPDQVREWDRSEVARFPELLARVGLHIVLAEEKDKTRRGPLPSR
jgi:ppGpp synthetase/RelA/SpoT-type nucleotidyltranferase/8-oxo-dGTP pyrophosphatase MutT (NUDIX family)